MFLKEARITGYRSVRDLRLSFGQLTVVVGPNGAGKSNLYRALTLVSAAARGQFSAALAEEGGIPSALWAGARRKSEAVRMSVDLAFDELEYEFAAGPVPKGPDDPTLFALDPDVKEERIYAGSGKARALILERKGPSAFARTGDGDRVTFGASLWPYESVLAQLNEPHRFPILSVLKQLLTSWRFYHHFPSDADAPSRRPQTGIRTTVLAADGRDLAAALQTIREISDRRALDAAISNAFPGSAVEVEATRGEFVLRLTMPGLHRPLEARELSDGTLRYLCLVAALLSPRSPPLFAFNEPETSLHPDLLEPLAQLIIDALPQTQIWVTTHSEKLVRALERSRATIVHRIAKENGETVLVEE